jgi:hypothetical protein
VQYIKGYTAYLNEAYMSDYSRERYEERVGNIGDVRISGELQRSLRADGIDFKDIKDQVIELIVEKLDKRLQNILRGQYSNLTFAVPVLAAKLWVGNSSDYIKIVTKSTVYKKVNGKYVRDENGELIAMSERSHIGEKFYMPIANDYIETLLLYPIGLTNDEIEASFEEHGLRKNKNERLRVQPLTADHILNLEVVDGRVKEKTFSSDSNVDYTVDQQWAIAVGRKLKFFSKMTNDFVEATVVELIEPTVKQVKDANKKTNVIWLGAEKQVRAKLDTGKSMPTVKTFKVDDIVYLPIGTDDAMIKCKIVSPTYIIDERSNNPVNLKFRAIK